MANIEYTYDSILNQRNQEGGGSEYRPPPRKPIEGVVVIKLPKMPDIRLPSTDIDFESQLKLPDALSSENVDQKLGLENSGNNKKNIYEGSQVIINSDRIVMNSRSNYLMLFGGAGVALASPGPVNIDSEASITLFGEDGLFLGVPNKGNEWKKTTKEANKAKATPNDAYEPLVLGLKLVDILEDILFILQTARLVGTTTDVYFDQPTQHNFQNIVARLPEMLSTYAYIDGVSHEAPLDPPEPPKDYFVPMTTLQGRFKEVSGATDPVYPGMQSKNAGGAVDTIPGGDLAGFFEPGADPHKDGPLK